MRFFHERGGSGQESGLDRFSQWTVDGEFVVVRGSPEDRVSPDAILLRELRIKEASRRIPKGSQPKICAYAPEQRSGPFRCNSFHHPDTASAQDNRRARLTERRVPVMLETTNGLAIGRKHPLELV